MNSENKLNSTSETNKLQNEEKEHNRVKVVVGAVCIIVMIMAVVTLITYQNRVENIRNKYDKFCKSYNEYVDIYNSVTTKYNTLVDIVSKEGKKIVSEEVSSIDYYESDFEQFYDDGVEWVLLNEKLGEVSLKIEDMTKAYNQLCLSSYNDAINDYNVMAEKLNLLVERLDSYHVSSIPDKEELKSQITDDYDTYYKKWVDVNILINEINYIQQDVDKLNEQYYDACAVAYNSVVNDYNIVAKEYNDIVEVTSIHFIEGMQEEIALKEKYNTSEILNFEEDELCSELDEIIKDTDILVANYLVANQITNPTEDWVLERLNEVDSITGLQAVTKSNDPNGLLGKEGGYTNCVYFTIKDIAPNSVKGKNIVEKGTDAGGAIEVYSTLEYALNRCDYLSQFDGTLLYSGGYAIIGTMVVRTSYKLSDSQQVELINEITKVLTRVE